jgi:hypothetical protein
VKGLVFRFTLSVKENLMHTARLASLALLVALAACGSKGLSPAADLSMPDLAVADRNMSMPPIDLAAHQSKIFCGSQICDQPMVCCYTQTGATFNVSATCAMPGTCGDGGIQGSCDGPADCGGATPDCCMDLSLAHGNQLGGSAQCTASCQGMGGQKNGTTSLTTKLCYSDSDCAGYTGVVQSFPVAFNNCCSRNGIPVHFCAPPASLAQNAYTCP